MDRGKNSLETILLLFSYCLLYPQDVYVLRGNHELKHINLTYGFFTECKKRMSEEIYNKINEVFEWMPLAATVNEAFFCCHGGLGPELKSLIQIEEIQRPMEDYNLPELVRDLLWADPCQTDKGRGFKPNRLREISWMWGSNIAEKFLNDNNLELIIRAHETQMNGVSYNSNRRGITVFSAP